MTLRQVKWLPGARDNLLALYDWIAERASPAAAYEYTANVQHFANALSEFPDRGTPRDDLSPGIRTRVYRRRTVVAYRVTDDAVCIVALLHRGQVWSDGAFD